MCVCQCFIIYLRLRINIWLYIMIGEGARRWKSMSNAILPSACPSVRPSVHLEIEPFGIGPSKCVWTHCVFIALSKYNSVRCVTVRNFARIACKIWNVLNTKLFVSNIYIYCWTIVHFTLFTYLLFYCLLLWCNEKFLNTKDKFYTINHLKCVQVRRGRRQSEGNKF